MVRGHESQGVEHQVADLIVPVYEEDHLVIVLRPLAVEEVVLAPHLLAHGLVSLAGQQLLPDIHALIHAAHGGEIGGVIPAVHGAHGVLHQGHDVALDDLTVLVLGIDVKAEVIAVLDGSQIGDPAAALVQVLLEILQVVGLDLRLHHGVEHVVHHCRGVDTLPVVVLAAVPPMGAHKGDQQVGHIGTLRHDGNGVAGQGLLLDLLNVTVDAGGQGQDQGDADDADGPGEAGQQGPALLGHEVVQGQGEGGGEAHGGLFLPLFRLWGLLLHAVIGGGVVHHPAVQQADGPVGVLFRQLRVVGDHDDQLLPGNLRQQVHDLHAGLAVQCPGGLVGQQNVRVVYQGPCDGHPLHLASGELVGALFDLVPQAHLFQGLLRPAASFPFAHAGKGQGQLHVGKDALVGDEVVALEDEADGVIAVGVPVAVPEFSGRTAINDEVAAGVLVQTAYNVQQGGLAAAGVAQNGNKFIFPEAERHPPQGGDVLAAGLVHLDDIV